MTKITVHSSIQGIYSTQFIHHDSKMICNLYIWKEKITIKIFNHILNIDDIFKS